MKRNYEPTWPSYRRHVRLRHEDSCCCGLGGHGIALNTSDNALSADVSAIVER